MCRLMVDTNVLLDLVSPDRQSHVQAKGLFVAAVNNEGCELLALASSLKDVYYLMHRHYGSEVDARRAIRKLVELVSLLSCDAELIGRAIDGDEPDFEDGLVRCAAERVMVDSIVTRDKSGFLGSAIPKLTPAEATALVASGC